MFTLLPDQSRAAQTSLQRQQGSWGWAAASRELLEDQAPVPRLDQEGELHCLRVLVTSPAGVLEFTEQIRVVTSVGLTVGVG